MKLKQMLQEDMRKFSDYDIKLAIRKYYSNQTDDFFDWYDMCKLLNVIAERKLDVENIIANAYPLK